jgi:hypothetical protein
MGRRCHHRPPFCDESPGIGALLDGGPPGDRCRPLPPRHWNGRGLTIHVPESSAAWIGSASSRTPSVFRRSVHTPWPPSISTWRAKYYAILIMPGAVIRRGSLPSRRKESLDRPRSGFRWQVMRRRDARCGVTAVLKFPRVGGMPHPRTRGWLFVIFGETGWSAVGTSQSPVQPMRTCSTETESRRHLPLKRQKDPFWRLWGISLVVSAITPTRQRWCHPGYHTPRAPMTYDRTFRAVGPKQSPCRSLSRFPASDLAMANSARQGDVVRGVDGGDRLHTPIHGAQLIATSEHPLTPKPAFGRVWHL